MKTQRLLVAAAVLVLIAAFVQWGLTDSAPRTDARLGQPLLLAEQVEQIDRFALHSPQGSLELEKQEGFWWLKAEQFPADAVKLRRLVQQLMAAEVAFKVAQGKEKLAKFGLEPGQGRLLEFFSGPESLAQIHLGHFRQPPGGEGQGHEGGGDGTYLRFGDAVYLVQETLRPPLESESWKLDQLLSLPKDQIRSLSGPGWQMSREAPVDGFALKDGRVAGPQEIQSRVRLLGNWRFNKALPKAQAPFESFGQPQKFKVETFGGAQLELIFWPAKSGGEDLLALAPTPGSQGVFSLAERLAGDWVFSVPSWQLKTWAAPPVGL